MSNTKSQCLPTKVNYIRVNEYKDLVILRQLELLKFMDREKLGNLVLIHSHQSLSKSLTQMFFKICPKNGCCPTTWKLSQKTTIIKEGNQDDVRFYRPIIMNCSSSKVLKLIVLNVIYYVAKEKTHDSNHGFQKRRSTTIQLLLFPETL